MTGISQSDQKRELDILFKNLKSIGSRAAAKKKGATEEMIKEMIDVMGVANQNNKLVEAYGVEVDEIYK